jgi:hypothetical protein
MTEAFTVHYIEKMPLAITMRGGDADKEYQDQYDSEQSNEGQCPNCKDLCVFSNTCVQRAPYEVVGRAFLCPFVTLNSMCKGVDLNSLNCFE